MIIIRLIVCIFMFVPIIACAESNYWDRVEELAKLNTPQGNPALERYLRNLTPEQTLQAAREYCDEYQVKYKEDQWAQAGAAVGIIMAVYGDEENGLTDKKLSPILDIIADTKEGYFFRETLTRLLRHRFWINLTDIQRKQSREVLLSVLMDTTASSQLRALSCRELSLSLAENYRSIIISDKNVSPLRNDKQKWRNIDDLVRKGDVQLDPETQNELKAIRAEIEVITPTLDALSQDAAESPEVKNRVQNAIETLNALPVAP